MRIKKLAISNDFVANLKDGVDPLSISLLISRSRHLGSAVIFFGLVDEDEEEVNNGWVDPDCQCIRG